MHKIIFNLVHFLLIVIYTKRFYLVKLLQQFLLFYFKADYDRFQTSIADVNFVTIKIIAMHIIYQQVDMLIMKSNKKMYSIQIQMLLYVCHEWNLWLIIIEIMKVYTIIIAVKIKKVLRILLKTLFFLQKYDKI